MRTKNGAKSSRGYRPSPDDIDKDELTICARASPRTRPAHWFVVEASADRSGKIQKFKLRSNVKAR